MCIIITGASNKMRDVLFTTPGLLSSIYQSNSDGLGLMFPSARGTVEVRKSLPKSEEAALKFLKRYLPKDDREVALHARYATHGDTNKGNCHPYATDGGMLMHNGVLSIGNKEDETKSDTWHFCRAYLDGTAHALMDNEVWRAELGKMIGPGNRFVFLGRDGRMHVINKNTGVVYNDLWFSNTYAWDVSTLDPTWYDEYAGYFSGRSGDPRAASSGTYKGTVYRRRSKSRAVVLDEKEVWDLPMPTLSELQDSNGSYAWMLSLAPEDLGDYLEQVGSELVEALIEEFAASNRAPYQAEGGPDGSFVYAACLDAVLEEDYNEIDFLLHRGHGYEMAEAILDGLVWPKEDPGEADAQTLLDVEVAEANARALEVWEAEGEPDYAAG